MTRRWRPSLAFVLGGALAGTLVLSFLGLVVLRYLGPEIGFRAAASLVALVIAAATALLGWLLVRLLLRPIRALESYARAEGAAARPVHFGTRELRATAVRVIAMAEALRDREATVRAYTNHVTHELKTPVAAIRAATELLEDGGALGPEDARLLAQIDGARGQLEAQLAALRAAARAREVRYLGQTRLSALATELRAAHPEVRVDVSGPDITLPMAPAGLKLVLGQLLGNAAAHGAARVTLEAGADADGSLTVRDDGPGLPEADRARIFEPFYTTRRETGGTGMGLTIAAAILGAHGARIEALPGPGGAAFRIVFEAAALR